MAGLYAWSVLVVKRVYCVAAASFVFFVICKNYILKFLWFCRERAGGGAWLFWKEIFWGNGA